jgi:hypothetical protein
MENYEGTAIDPSIFEDGQLETEPTQTEAVETVESEVTPAGDTAESNEPVKYNIDGVGEFTADEIREFKNGSLRQSDYTKKTQELARQRDELKEADTLYTYLKQNPHIVEAMRQAEQNPNPVINQNTPSYERELLKDVIYNQKAMETDIKLTTLHQKYGDFDESALFSKATELQTENLEFVLKGLMYDNSYGSSAVVNAKEQLKAELEANRDVVSTVVSETNNSQNNTNTIELSPEEKRVAAGMGLSESDYAKWKL